MTRELARVLDEEFAELTPPSAMTGRAIVQKGRKVRRRRRFAYGGAGVAVVAALALLLPPMLPGGAPADSADPPPYSYVDQPEFPLPELDPDAGYVWHLGNDGIRTPETAAVDAVWLERVRAIEGAKAYVHTPEAVGEPLTDANYPGITRHERELMIRHGTGYSRIPGGGFQVPYYQGGEVVLDFGNGDWSERLMVEVYAKGSFLPGPGQPAPHMSGPDRTPGPYAIDGCEDYSVDVDGGLTLSVHYTCTETAGPAGERVVVVESKVAYSPGDQVDPEIAVALYRGDGTAVVVRDALTSIEETRSPQGPREFGLTPEDLLELALWIPPVLVK